MNLYNVVLVVAYLTGCLVVGLVVAYMAGGWRQ